MKHIVAGIVAHVDAGKTTLSEALLYQTGALRSLGRVDKGDAFLDPDTLEKQRGITIFSHEASFQTKELAVDLLDTPGHVDFASQTEQVLSVLDAAILVVAATDGVQGYTRTLWRLLARYQIPTFIFVNKIDAASADEARTITQLQTQLAGGCIPFAQMDDSTQESIALQDDAALEVYTNTGHLSDDAIRQLIAKRKVFPVYSGSALKLAGVTEFLTGFEKWTQAPAWPADFGAKVFKISHDDKGERLTWLRVTGGSLKPKQILLGEQKVNQLRVYNGERYQVVPKADAGTVCVVPGLTATRPGMGLGHAQDSLKPAMQPVLTYALDPKGNDIRHCLSVMRELEDEDPQLHVAWSEQLQEIRVQLMGAVQLEILQQLLQTRFHLDVGFDAGSILYKETITQAAEGVGHFEPLRHYAEVHLLLQPGKPGSGLQFDANVSLEVLGRNWQQQVLSSLQAKVQLGVLIGAPLTDVKVTLVTGRSHLEHTVGGDFREASWRALRQGLMVLKSQDACQLLEPWYQFTLEVGQDQIGRAMTDVQKMSGTFDLPKTSTGSGLTTLTGEAPVSEMQNYAQTVSAYTHGQGQLECLVAGYRPCHNAEAVIQAAAYDPVGDVANTPGSVFCAHGAGYPVHWDEVPSKQHVENVYSPAKLAALNAQAN